MSAPFVAILLSGSVCSIVITILSSADSVRKTALACSIMLLGLSVIEACLYFATRSQVIITETIPRYWRQDAMSIGPLPLPGTATEFREFLDGKLITDVSYRIDRNRLREIPPKVQGH